MRKLLFIIALLTGCAHAQVAVSGHILNPSGQPIPGAFAKFVLVNCGDNMPTVLGVGTVYSTISFNSDPATGAISGVIYTNDQIRCAGQTTTRWSVTNYVNGQPQVTSHYYIQTGIPFNLDTATALGTIPAPPTWDNVYLRIDGSSVDGQATGGQVPQFDATVGRYRPQTVGGFNLHSPGPIGDGMSDSGAFTTLSLTGFTYPDFGFRVSSFYTSPVYGRTANNVFTVVRGSIGTPDLVGDAGIFSQYIGSLGVSTAGNTPSAILGEAIAQTAGGSTNVVGVMGEAVTNAVGVGNAVGGIGVFGQSIINADGNSTNNIFSWGGFFASADFGHAYAHPLAAEFSVSSAVPVAAPDMVGGVNIVDNSVGVTNDNHVGLNIINFGQGINFQGSTFLTGIDFTSASFSQGAIKNASFGTGIGTSGTGLKHFRICASGCEETYTPCTTAATAGATCAANVNLPGNAFADTNYTITCTINGSPTGAPMLGISAKGASTFQYYIQAATAAAATIPEIDCIAIHN